MDITINICKTHGNNCDGRCIDPNVDNGMMTKVWGPAGWLFLHCVSFGYPENPDTHDIDNGFSPGTTRNRYTRFFREIGNILPC